MTSAREAIDALRRVTSLARARASSARPPQPPTEALDELARVADLLGRAVEDVAGDDGEAVQVYAEGLASAITARRDALTR